MKNNIKDYKSLEFLTSLISLILLIILTVIQYWKGRPFWWILVLVTILMAANSYLKYKKIKKESR
ncbi:hypothetical protein HV819_07115 [Anaerococcus sp. AGMB00486]|uniref:Uncharacterized protein n=2 Tax=Anaerococcus TaxID=165779 RepID=A0ABX2NAL7_9FIRM|nr:MULTISPECIES: hypothetical protein [Anaerococcus]MDY3006921.1 hypothetical protein [Anaerococcus porci]MSS78529.1 hypothetical protein [Anaerococcus porci]NVF11747.1 hypothetical protein [Anaerococcus faecalis]